MSFKRRPPGRPQTNIKDTRGTVRVEVFRVDGTRYVKGNVYRSCTVHDSTVLEVFEALEDALFDEVRE
jgi:hypothetical protein